MLETNVIYNGDCIGENGMQRLPDKSIDLIVTDPPYNASKSNMKSDNKDYNSVNEKWDKNFKIDFVEIAWDKLKDTGSMLIFCDYHTINQYLNWQEVRQILHWEKSNAFPALAKVYTFSFEYILWYTKGSPYTFNKKKAGRDKITTPICSGNERTKHPTQKPIKLIDKLIEVHSNENDIVLDPFIGSGTTAVACLKNDRKFIGFEKEEKYYNIALKRIGKFNKSYYEELNEEMKPKQEQLF